MKSLSSVEKVNIDRALEAFDNNRFRLILAASARAREIAGQRITDERNGNKVDHQNKPTVEALREIADGVVGKEYLNKIK